MKATVLTAFGAFGAGELQLTDSPKARASKQVSLRCVELFMAEVSSERTVHSTLEQDDGFG
jgi:hypothetical protein